MSLKVPYSSSVKEASDPFWKIRACGVVCLKMVLTYLKPEDRFTVDEIIAEGEAMGGFASKGWSHGCLVIILRNHGVLAYNQEFRTAKPELQPQFIPSKYSDEFLNRAIAKIAEEVKNGRPVIVSIPGHQRIEGETHMVVIVGIEEREGTIEGFYFNDPDDSDGTHGENRFIKLADFIRDWRRFAVFVE